MSVVLPDTDNGWPKCSECGEVTWRQRCTRSRCPGNSEKHLRRQSQRIRANVASFGGDVVMVTLTAPGDLGEVGCWGWNASMFERWRDLRHVAAQDARRRVKGQRNGLLVVVPELQRRGALHLHLLLGAETLLERRWCEAFVRALRRNRLRHGFGQQMHAPLRGGSWSPARAAGEYVGKLGRYLSKAGGLRTMHENRELPARAFYVSRRLTSASGVTMRMLRRRAIAWGGWGVSVTVKAISEWRDVERELGRELVNRVELLWWVDGARPVRT
jgi:hypothetical protein